VTSPAAAEDFFFPALLCLFHADVAAKDEGQSATGGRPVHGSDNGLAQCAQARDQAGDVLLDLHGERRGAIVGRTGWSAVAAEVETRAEPAPRTREDHDPSPAAGAEAIQFPMQHVYEFSRRLRVRADRRTGRSR
jgi:hypothetical protein